VGHVVCKRNEKCVLVGIPEGKKSFGRTRLRWEDNIRMGIRKRRCEDVLDLSSSQ
jgi:hypothetical protein